MVLCTAKKLCCIVFQFVLQSINHQNGWYKQYLCIHPILKSDFVITMLKTITVHQLPWLEIVLLETVELCILLWGWLVTVCNQCTTNNGCRRGIILASVKIFGTFYSQLSLWACSKLCRLYRIILHCKYLHVIMTALQPKISRQKWQNFDELLSLLPHSESYSSCEFFYLTMHLLSKSNHDKWIC